MGLFDFFKKKSNDNGFNDKQENELFSAISQYKEYIIRFIIMQQQDNYAPISAYQKLNGEIVGLLYVYKDESEGNSNYSLTAKEVVEKMTHDYEEKLNQGEIKSYMIFYHSQYANDNNHAVANNNLDTKAISLIYHFKNSLEGTIGLPYHIVDNQPHFERFYEFSEEENSVIFTTQLQTGKDYFQDKIFIEQSYFKNEFGIEVTRSSSKDVHNTWCGIFGFESFKKTDGDKSLEEHMAFAVTYHLLTKWDKYGIYQVGFDKITLKTITIDGVPATATPIIHTDVIVDVENKHIDEWENIHYLEAIVSGNGKDTFGVWYFATDYAENRNRYLTEKKLNIKISGIAYVIDTHEQTYTAYLPSSHLPGYACFDFFGILEDFVETETMGAKGFILKVKLITNNEIEDFFTIDIFANKENMRTTELIKGMKISGMFQMQGRIAD